MDWATVNRERAKNRYYELKKADPDLKYLKLCNRTNYYLRRLKLLLVLPKNQRGKFVEAAIEEYINKIQSSNIQEIIYRMNIAIEGKY